MPVKRRQTRQEEVPDAEEGRAPRWLWAAVLSVSLIISIVLSVSFLGIPSGEPVPVTVEETAKPFDPDQPFTLSDLSASQLTQLRESSSHKLEISDGPRSISVGDSLDKLLAAYPSNYAGEQLPLENSTSGTLYASEQILYCDSTFVNANGILTALPPRGLLSDDGGRNLVVTLMAPTTAYPPGTADNYRKFEHIYIKYTIDPDTMCVSSILLGLTD